MKQKRRRLERIPPQQLRAFEAVARLGSVTAAAAELHVTQPTVSVQLRELSLAVGEPLLEPAGRKLRLTQAGEALQQTVGELTSCWARLDARLAEIHGLLRGRLRLAAVTTAEYFVPDLVGPFAAAHPGVEIEIAVENRDRVIERLGRAQDDLAVMMLPPSELPLERVPFLDNPLVVIAPAGHRLAGRRVRLDQLAGERWLMREPGSGTRRVAEEHFAAKEFTPNVAMSLGSNEAIKHAVAAGLGVAVVSELAVQPPAVTATGPAPSGLAVLQVAGFPIRRRWSVVWRRDQALTAAARRFVAYLQEPPASAVSSAPGQSGGKRRHAG
jgi:DNA-binding transcriptional LysR family regulator